MLKKKLILFDGHNLLFRMFFGMPNKIYAADGHLIHGTIGFIGSILKILRECCPCNVCVVFDSEKREENREYLHKYYIYRRNS